MNPDDNWVHVSDIDVPPLTFEVGIQTTNISSPSLYTRITPLPLPHNPNSNMDKPIHTHQVPLPESRPASVVGSVLSLFGARRVLSRARGNKAASDVGVDSTQLLIGTVQPSVQLQVQHITSPAQLGTTPALALDPRCSGTPMTMTNRW